MGVGWVEELQRRLGGRQVDLGELLTRVVDEAVRQLHADRGTLYLVDHARQELVSRVAHLPEIAEIRLRIGEGVAGLVARVGRPMRVQEGEGLIAGRVDAVTGYHTRSAVAAPLLDARGGVVGVLQLLNRHDQRGFDAADERALVELAAALSTLLASTSLRSQLHPNARQPLAYRFNHIVGESPAMLELYERTARAARTEATVLIRGESGSGKELVARAIHDNSARREGPFVKVDCAALPENLVENELFGHERGAFTSADRSSEGKVEAAQGGTLFLDEVGELPLLMQGKLLRLLQERTYFRLGSSKPARADVRFVCATHRPLERAVAEGSFRQDLYYRLRVVELVVPPLRERGGADLDRLIDHFVYELGAAHHRPEVRLSAEARRALHAHDWPGNVRELEHALERAVVLAPGPVIEPEHLGIAPRPAAAEGGFRAGTMTLAELERDYIRYVLATCGGNRSRAARVLGIGRNTLLRKLE